MSLFNNLGGGDIWGSNGFLFTSPINDILEKENFTLIELLQEDEIIQEVKSLNTKLIDFLAQEDTVQDLIRYIKEKPGPEDDENRTIRYPYMACEVICCETQEILETICSAVPRSQQKDEDQEETSPPEDSSGTKGTDEEENLVYPFLDQLFQFLDQPSPLDHRLAGYFEKVVSTLLRHRCLALVGYINTQGAGLFHKFARHVANYSISQLIKRLLLPKYACVESELFFWDLDAGVETERAGNSGLWCRWSQWPEVLPSLLDQLRHLSADNDTSTCQHVAEIFLSLVEQPSLGSKLLERLTDGEMIETLLNHTIPDDAENIEDPTNAQAMTAAAKILRSLVLRFTSPAEVVVVLPMMGIAPTPMSTGSDDEGTDPPLTMTPRPPPQHLTDALCSKIPKMVQCIRSHESDEAFTMMQTKQTIPKLGILRLELVRLLDAVMRLRDEKIDKCFEEQEALALVMDLFFKYEWNNTLHHAVASIITRIIELPGPNSNNSRDGLLKQLLSPTKCRLIDRILEAHSKNKAQQETNNSKLGYMGHITIISMALVGQCNPTPPSGALGGEEKVPQETKYDAIHSTTPNSLVKSLLAELENSGLWEAYVLGDLAVITTLQSAPLGGFHVPSRFEENVLSTDFSEEVLTDMDDAVGVGGTTKELNTLTLSTEVEEDIDEGPLSIDDDDELVNAEKINDGVEEEGDLEFTIPSPPMFSLEPPISPDRNKKENFEKDEHLAGWEDSPPRDSPPQERGEKKNADEEGGWADFSNFESADQEDVANFDSDNDGISEEDFKSGLKNEDEKIEGKFDFDKEESGNIDNDNNIKIAL
mmetsp:Transcript_1429/g.1835  ORF Transcript_1429/g.1835 Transcript_1429/m.1835 type:complete len:819 (-) Transcript_1429:283-2739(-)